MTMALLKSITISFCFFTWGYIARFQGEKLATFLSGSHVPAAN